LSNKTKEEELKDLIKMENLNAILILETNMDENEVLNVGKK
jgi:hypothetical protein